MQYVCMYICVYVCMYVCMYVYMYVSWHRNMYRYCNYSGCQPEQLQQKLTQYGSWLRTALGVVT